jgi:hypothetical protein
MTTWFDDPLRPTRDLDLLGFGAADPEAMVRAFSEICALVTDDGVAFDSGDIVVDRIRDAQEYGGFRIKTRATVGGARVRVFIDIGFGDAVEPGLTEMELRPRRRGAPAFLRGRTGASGSLGHLR